MPSNWYDNLIKLNGCYVNVNVNVDVDVDVDVAVAVAVNVDVDADVDVDVQINSIRTCHNDLGPLLA